LRKYSKKNAVGTTPGKILHAGSDVRVEVNIVGSQDTTGLMTSRIGVYGCYCISPIVDGAYQSGCHTASVWDNKSKANIPRFEVYERFRFDYSTRPKRGIAMTDVIHKVLNDITVDEWAIHCVVTLTQECQRELLLVLIQEL
jgi:aconitate hydratase 2/2-methylisocitrate dehydratase